MFEKHLWKSDILSKDAARWPAFLLKMSLFHRCFLNILQGKTKYLVLSLISSHKHRWRFSLISVWICLEAVFQRCTYENVFWKYAANLQDNTHAEVWFCACFFHKIFFLYFNWPNFFLWLSLLLEISGNMCIVIICYPVCDVINF